MSTNTLTRAARRELTAVRVAADIRYAKLATTFDYPTGDLTTVPYFTRNWTRKPPVAPKVAEVTPKVKAHRTSVTAVDGKFLAVCTCGDPIQARPTGEAYAKGMGTKHINATSVVAA